MTQLTALRNFNIGHLLQEPSQEETISFWTRYNMLLVGAFLVDLITPILIWKRILPGSSRYLSDVAIAILLVMVFMRMLIFNRIPLAAFLIGFLSLIGFVVGLFEGQGLLPTAWGWWRMFRYPMAGLFAYLHPHWPERFPERLIKLCLWILALQVVVQIFLFLGGEVAGDDLSGTFGRKGVGPLMLFILFALCMALGHWLGRGNGILLIWILALGGLASALSGQKMFPFAIVALGIVTLMIYQIRGGKFHYFLLYAAIFLALAQASVHVYNRFVVEGARDDTKRLEEFFDLQTLDKYLGGAGARGDGNYNLGRNFALQLGWQNIQRDTVTFLFGMGLGTRSSSVTLGFVGAGLARSDYGWTSGTSLLVMMQEIGIAGLGIFFLFIGWAIFKLAFDISRDTDTDTNALRYGLILFSVYWPLWLWYHQTWTFGVVMLLYWVSLGYLLSHPPQPDKQTPLPAGEVRI